MNWTETENGNYIDLSKSYYLYVQKVDRPHTDEILYYVSASFQVSQGHSDDLESESIPIKKFDSKESAKRFLDEIMQKLQ